MSDAKSLDFLTIALRSSGIFSTALSGRLPDGSSGAVPPDTSPPLARWPDLTLRSSDSIDPATPTGRAGADLPTAPTGPILVAAVRSLATTFSYTAGLR